MIKKILAKIRSWWFSKSPIPYQPLQITNVMPAKPAVTIKVYAGDKLLGAIQSFSIQEYSPQNEEASINIHVRAQRVRFDKLRVAEAFSRGFVHPASQVYPLQIEADDGKNVVSIENAWITSTDQCYSTNDWVIVNEMELEAEKSETKKKS